MPDTISQFGETLVLWKAKLIEFAVRYGFEILGAFVILFIGLKVATYVGRLLEGRLSKTSVEPPLISLLVRAVKVIIIGVTLVISAEKIGVPVTSLIAGLGVAGVGIGLSMQGVLGNVFAGLTILFTKPFRVGEYVDMVGIEGEVSRIDLFNTTLVHPDHSHLVIPNRKIVGEILHNHGKVRQLDLRVGVAYGSDIDKTLSTALSVMKANAKVLEEPAPMIGIFDLGDSAINLSARVWVQVIDYEHARLELYKALVEAFRSAEIEIPFPQREVRLLNAEEIGGGKRG